MKIEIESKFEVGDVVYPIKTNREIDEAGTAFAFWRDTDSYEFTAIQIKFKTKDIVYCGTNDPTRWLDARSLENNAFKTKEEAVNECAKRNVELDKEFKVHLETMKDLKNKAVEYEGKIHDLLLDNK